jgi:hypothetical protein
MWKIQRWLIQNHQLIKDLCVFFIITELNGSTTTKSYQTIQMIYKRLVILLLKGIFEQLQ